VIDLALQLKLPEEQRSEIYKPIKLLFDDEAIKLLFDMEGE